MTGDNLTVVVVLVLVGNVDGNGNGNLLVSGTTRNRLRRDNPP